MKKNEVFQLRLEPEELAELHRRAGPKGSAANVIREALGFKLSAGPGRLKASAQKAGGSDSPPDASSAPDREQRVRELVAQGNTTLVARRMVRRELGD